MGSRSDVQMANKNSPWVAGWVIIGRGQCVKEGIQLLLSVGPSVAVTSCRHVCVNYIVCTVSRLSNRSDLTAQ